MIEFFRYDRWDNYYGPISDVVKAVHKQEAGGENGLIITTESDLQKGDRIVWLDDTGTYHEHVANEPKATRDGTGKVAYETYCEDAMNELFRDKVDEVRIRNGSARQALSAILRGTRWEVGTVSVSGAQTKSFYHVSAGEALQDLVKTWGGEAYSSFTVDDFGITHRYVNIAEAMGIGSTHRRFEYGKDLASVKRTVSSDDVYTAMRGYGKGDDLGDDDEGTNGRRITFADINNGKDYVEDLDALARWGRPDGNGGKAHAFGTVVFGDCEDKSELLELTRKELDGKKEPKISYECEVQDLAAMGYDYEGVAVGDGVQVIDTAFTPELELDARVMAIERNLLDASDSKITIGNIRPGIGNELSAINSSLNSIRGQSSSWDAAVSFGETYLQKLVDSLNSRFDAMGSYINFSFEQGLTVSSVPLNDEGKPAITPASAINLRGGGFRIAADLKADGSFNWRTFGTGEGFVADYIVAGSLLAGLINTGVLLVGDEKDPVFMADFDSKKVSIKGSSVTIGAGDAESAISGLEDGVSAARAVYGYCTTAANVDVKTVSIDGFELSKGATVRVRFQHENSAAAPKLNVNGTGAYSIMLNGSTLSEENFWRANEVIEFVYDGYWRVSDSGSHSLIKATNDAISLEVSGVKKDLSDTKSSIEVMKDGIDLQVSTLQEGLDDATSRLTCYGSCSTSASDGYKNVNVGSDFTLKRGVTVSVNFNYSNTAQYPHLNVNDTGAYFIYVGQSLMSSDYWWRAGTTVTFVYTGSNWRVCDAGALARIKVAEGEIELRVEKGTLSSEISAEAGLISIESNRFEWDSIYSSMSRYGRLTASSASITGTVTTGTDTGYKAQMTGGHVKFYYNNNETIELVSIPSYTSGAKGGYLQACDGATYLGLRAPHLYTAVNTSEAGTIGATGDIWVAGWESSPGDGWSMDSMKAYSLKFINGICVSGNVG